MIPIVGCFELLIVVGVILALIRLLRSREFRVKMLDLLRRAPRIIARHPFLVSLGLAVLALMLLSESAHKPGHPVTTFLFVLLLLAAALLFLWALLRSFGLTLVINRPPPCPPIDLLKAFLAEQLASNERARLTAHLEDCSACQHRVEGLTAGKKSWSEMAQKLSTPPPSPEPALRKVMEQLKESNEEATSDEPVRTADLPLGFLSPTDKPGLLGKLERYEVLAEIGRGGMGIVLKAFDPTLHRVVAIKVLAPQLATSGVARKRFLREAKAAAAVTHDHIVTIHAVDEANGVPYLVMQYIAGQSLQDRIDREGPLELAEVLRIGMQTASGLAAAHGQGIVHRDVKPANILLEEGLQRVKITDFGLALAMDDASLTQSGFVAGSPLYMAPEQARVEALDHRADLFSLGSVLYTMCTGRPPFRAANTLAVLRRVTEDRPRPIRETNPEIPDWLAAVVDKLMAKDPSERYQSAGEVVEILGQQLAQLQHRPWVPSPSPAPAAGNPTAGLPTSVTICPSCGASLHVPERMVGTVVHCAECGKPFQVAEGSEVIQVARPVSSPLGPGFRPRMPVPAWQKIAFAGAALPLALFLFGSLVAIHDTREAVKVPPMATAPKELPHTVSVPPPRTPAFWKNTLGWLPGRATLFGAIDIQSFGSLTLDDPLTRSLLRLVAGQETCNHLTPENLGRIRFDALGLAYYADPRTAETRVIANVEGVALDGRQRIVDYIRRTVPGEVQMEESERGLEPNRRPIGLSGSDLPFALGLYDDYHVFLARSLKGDGKEATHRKVLEKVPCFGKPLPEGTLVSGYQPPWLTSALASVPSDACGLALGEIPPEWQKVLTRTLNLRVCPRPFVCFIRRESSGRVILLLSLQVDKTNEVEKLREDLEKWCRQGLIDLPVGPPAKGKVAEALRTLGQTLRTLRWKVDDAGKGSIQTSVSLTVPTWNALLVLLEQAAQP